MLTSLGMTLDLVLIKGSGHIGPQVQAFMLGTTNTVLLQKHTSQVYTVKNSSTITKLVVI